MTGRSTTDATDREPAPRVAPGKAAPEDAAARKPASKGRKAHFADPRRARVGRTLTLAGYFGLLALILNWFAWIAPPERVPRAFPMIALAVPLLFPLRGLLHGRRYTHLWAGFLSMAYLAIGIDAWLNAAPGQGWLGAAMAVLATLLFVGTVVYARYTSSGTSAAARAEAEAEARLAASDERTP